MSDERTENKENPIVPLPGKKHKLESKWTLWFKDNISSDWFHSLHRIVEFRTIEDFWAVIKNVTAAKDLQISQGYALFRKDNTPLWEDPGNCYGGRWIMIVKPKIEAATQDIEIIWIELMMKLIGEYWEHKLKSQLVIHSNQLNGAMIEHLQNGQGFKISVWTTKDADNEKLNNVSLDLTKLALEFNVIPNLKFVHHLWFQTADKYWKLNYE